MCSRSTNPTTRGKYRRRQERSYGRDICIRYDYRVHSSSCVSLPHLIYLGTVWDLEIWFYVKVIEINILDSSLHLVHLLMWYSARDRLLITGGGTLLYLINAIRYLGFDVVQGCFTASPPFSKTEKYSEVNKCCPGGPDRVIHSFLACQSNLPRLGPCQHRQRRERRHPRHPRKWQTPRPKISTWALGFRAMN